MAKTSTHFVIAFQKYLNKNHLTNSLGKYRQQNLHKDLKKRKTVPEVNAILSDKYNISDLNHKLRNAMFYAQSKDILHRLVDGMHINNRDLLLNQKDENGDTPLLYHCRKGHWDVADGLLAYPETNVNEQDRIGYSILHHIGKYQCQVKAKLIQKLRNSGLVWNRVDINQQTALHVASRHGNATMVDLICKGEKKLINQKDKCGLTPLDLSANEEIYYALQNYQEGNPQSEIFQWCSEVKKNAEAKSYNVKETLGDILQKKGVGFLPNTREVDEIQGVIHMLMDCLKAGIQELDPDLDFDWTPSGSVNEGSKVHLPDECDFINKVVLLMKCVIPLPANQVGPSYVKFKQNGKIPEKLQDLFKTDLLVVERLFKRFYKASQILFSLKALWQVCGQLYRVEAKDITGSKTTISALKLYWHGKEFPWLEISIDLVPAVAFNPTNGLVPHAREPPDLAVAKRIDHAGKMIKHNLFQLSFSKHEGKLMRSLPGNGLETYQLSKIVRHPAFCKQIYDKGEEIAISEHITSYMLKSTIFKLHAEGELNENGHPLHNTIQVYQNLKESLCVRCLPMHFLPGQNIIEQYWKGNNHPDWPSHLKYSQDYCDAIIIRLKKNL